MGNKIKTNIIKSAAFIIRNLALLFGWSILLILILNYKRFDLFPYYMPLFISSIILIFPFRLLRSQQHLRIYLYVSFVNTLSLVLNSWRSPIEFVPVNFIYYSLLSILFILNHYFIYLYYKHRLESKLINPFIEKRKIIYFSMLSSIPISILLYLYLDIYSIQDKSGGYLASVPGKIPEADIRFTKKALESNYEVYSHKEEDHSVTAFISKTTANNNDYFELYDKGQKIYRVEFNKAKTIESFVYDRDGIAYPINTSVYYGQDQMGKFHEIPIQEEYKNMNKYKLNIRYLLSHPFDQNTQITNKEIIEGVRIDINKQISYPQKPKYIPLPFLRGQEEWQLTLKDSRGEIPLVESIKIWY